VSTRTAPLGQLAISLLKVGAFGFGGVGSVLALLRAELGTRRGWVTDAEVAEALGVVQTLPGSPGVLVVSFLAWRLGGWPGALLGSFCFVAIPAFSMVLASALLTTLPDVPAVRGALLGIQIAIVGILAANMLRMARSAARGRTLFMVLAAGLGIGAIASAAVAVITMGAVGAALAIRRTSKVANDE
jgi:chromate transporter